MNQETQRRLDRINQLQKTIQEAQAELEKVLGRVHGPTPSTAPAKARRRKTSQHVKYTKTVRAMTLEAIMAETGDWNAQKIRKNIQILNGCLVKTGSISCVLSDLKKEGVVSCVKLGRYTLNRDSKQQSLISA